MFKKNSTREIKAPKHEMDLVRGRLKRLKEVLKAILAAEIIMKLDREGLTVRGAHDRTGIAAADYSRIRNARLARFTVDRLVTILNRLGLRVETRLKVSA